MELFRDGVAAFLEAVGIAAVLWVLFDWFMYPKRAVNVTRSGAFIRRRGGA